MTVLHFSRVVFCLGCLPLLLAAADGDTDDSQGVRRPSFGFRADYYAIGPFRTSNTTASTTKPIADYSYFGSSDFAKAAVGPVVEWRLSKKLSVSGEFHCRWVRYTQETQTRTGTKSTTSSSDTRPVDYVTNSSKVNYWEVPVLLHYYGLAHHGLFSRAYASAGIQFRHLGQVKSAHEYIYADGTTDYSEIPEVPLKNNQVGVAAGLGLRFIDSFNIKVAPEVRYVRWQGNTFQGAAYRSAADQVQVGLGITF